MNAELGDELGHLPMQMVGNGDERRVDTALRKKLTDVFVGAAARYIVSFGEDTQFLGIRRHQRHKLTVLPSMFERGKHSHLGDVTETDDGIPDFGRLLGSRHVP
jgi:hypothetical protein